VTGGTGGANAESVAWKPQRTGDFRRVQEQSGGKEKHIETAPDLGICDLGGKTDNRGGGLIGDVKKCLQRRKEKGSKGAGASKEA